MYRFIAPSPSGTAFNTVITAADIDSAFAVFIQYFHPALDGVDVGVWEDGRPVARVVTIPAAIGGVPVLQRWQ